MAIVIHLDVLMAKSKIRGKLLAERIGITQANLSKLKTGRIKAIRLRTLDALCRELGCTPGDLLEYVPDCAVARDRRQRD